MERVVVDHIQNNSQAQSVQSLHHLPELQDSAPPIGSACVAALWYAVVDRVIAPVEAVSIRHRQHALLLLLTVRPVGGKVTL